MQDLIKLRKNRKYTVVLYNPNYVEQFEAYSKKIQNIFNDPSIKIEHIGSTAVIGMCGKPCIDILVMTENLGVVENHIQDMEKCGFEYAGSFVMDNSILFRLMKDGESFVNVHFFPIDHPHNKEMLDIRDYLISHPEEVKIYSNLKNQLFSKYPNDYNAYRKYKDEHMRGLMKKSRI